MQMLNNILVITDDTAPILELHRREKSCLELRTYTKALWKASYHFFSKIFNAIVRSRSFLKLLIRVKMKYFFGAVLFAYFITTLPILQLNRRRKLTAMWIITTTASTPVQTVRKSSSSWKKYDKKSGHWEKIKLLGLWTEKVCNSNLICATNKQSGSSLSSMSL